MGSLAERPWVENAWEVAPTLVALGYSRAEVAALAAQLSPAQFLAAIGWLNCSAAIYSLLEEIGQGAGRISEIVKALKSYTYLDQSPIQSVDIHEGPGQHPGHLAQQARPGRYRAP